MMKSFYSPQRPTVEVFEEAYDNLSICVPAFNEEAGILATLEELRAAFPRAEIILIDDGSEDATAELAQLVKDINVISHSRNIGYGGALKTAMRYATKNVVVWYDGDGQHTPRDLARVVQPVLAGDKDAVIGVRGQDSDLRIERFPGKLVLKWTAELLTGRKIPDLNSGLRCFRRNLILRYLHLLPNGFSASSTSTLLLINRGYRVGYIPITSQTRIGKSNVKILRDGLRTVRLLLHMFILFKAFVFFALFGVVQFGVGITYGLALALMNGRGFPVLASVIVISGVLTFFIGLLCDQIVALRLERMEQGNGCLSELSLSSHNRNSRSREEGCSTSDGA